jgi:DNA-binding NarL/FixJ family response regulator
MVQSLFVSGVSVSRTRVIVLTAHSMFTEGIAARLGQLLDQIDLQVVDSREPGCLAEIQEAQPAVIVLEANDENVDRFCSLDEILTVAPEVKVIRLDRDLDRIHVVTGEIMNVSQPDDFIGMLLPPSVNGAAGLE